MTPDALLAEARAALNAGNFAAAERSARQLLVLAPSAEAHDVLGNALRAQDRLEEALASADAALKLKPGNVVAQHGRALTLSRLGRYADSLATFDSLVARGVAAAPLWLNRGVALLGLTRVEEAEAAFADGVKRWPQDQGLQNALASTRWMRGEGATFARDYEDAVARYPDALFLRLGCADLLRRADQREQSEAVLREGLRRAPDDPQIQGALGVVLDEMDRTAEALPLLTRAVAGLPQLPFMRGNLISALLRLSRAQEALRQIEPLRAAQPYNGDWIAYQAMAWRQLSDARYHWLCDYELMVRGYDLEAPPGYATMAEFNAALRETLDRMHVLETHPLDQSLRHGSQTTRSLLTIDEPVIKQYLQALEAPIRAYIATMQDPDHPWSGRKSERFKLAGCWSVKLRAKGYHINHLHPEGWISSAYYVSLPEVTRSGESQEGWIKFGEPRWPTPGCTIEKVVQPKEGRLVLFPSYMWHGTIPFSAGERMTAPFDVVPA
ncbi:MAG: 2OG-Fe(II) oxygenase family protein [Hyphomonadaceae bacterium]